MLLIACAVDDIPRLSMHRTVEVSGSQKNVLTGFWDQTPHMLDIWILWDRPDIQVRPTNSGSRAQDKQDSRKALHVGSFCLCGLGCSVYESQNSKSTPNSWLLSKPLSLFRVSSTIGFT